MSVGALTKIAKGLDVPGAAQWLAQGFPFTHYIECVRAILLRGAGIDVLWWRALVLAGIAVAFVSLSVLRFAKSIE